MQLRMQHVLRQSRLKRPRSLRAQKPVHPRAWSRNIAHNNLSMEYRVGLQRYVDWLSAGE
jgi:hypothetical protein